MLTAIVAALTDFVKGVGVALPAKSYILSNFHKAEATQEQERYGK